MRWNRNLLRQLIQFVEQLLRLQGRGYQPHNDAARGLEVSLRQILETLLLKSVSRFSEPNRLQSVLLYGLLGRRVEREVHARRRHPS
jgi:hypothetical protein